jgi:hypothetical protein
VTVVLGWHEAKPEDVGVHTRQSKMYRVSWTRYEGRALARITLPGGALLAELEDYIRLRNPHFTDIRVEHATATEGYHTDVQPPRRWYKVTYLADDTYVAHRRQAAPTSVPLTRFGTALVAHRCDPSAPVEPCVRDTVSSFFRRPTGAGAFQSRSR